YADWDLTEKARQFGYNLQLTHLGELREASVLLAVRARLAIADGRINDAVRDLQTVFTVARHVARGPFLICPLIGMAIATEALTQLDELVQHPAAANLY